MFLRHGRRRVETQVLRELPAVTVERRQRFLTPPRVVECADQEQDAPLPERIRRDRGTHVREDTGRVAVPHAPGPALVLEQGALR